MEDVSKKLGLNIKRLRLDRKITQSDLASFLRVDKSFVSNIENGKTNPTLATIANIAKTLNVSTAELLQ